MKVYVFANCQGQRYAELFQRRCSGIDVDFDLSYKNLDNFDMIIEKMQAADIIVMQPVFTYENFQFENIKQYLKNSQLVLKIPFLRTWLYWPDEACMSLKKFDEESVMFFPDISGEEGVAEYLFGNLDKDSVMMHAESEIVKLKMLESTSDIKFQDFINKHYCDFPLFNDPYHPTQPLLNFIFNQLVEIIEKTNSISIMDSQLPTSGKVYESVYFRPIRQSVAGFLGLDFNLDDYYTVDRENYLRNILKYEKGNGDKIVSRRELFLKVFNIL